MKAGWQLRALADVAECSLGKMLDKQKNRGVSQPYLRNINVRWFDFDLTDLLEMPFEASESDRYTIRRGDLVICEGGYPGRCAVWQDDAPIFFQKALHRVRFHEPERAKWVQYFLWMSDADESLRRHFTGSGIQHFTGQALAKLHIPFPPLEEQRRIVAMLDEAFAAIAVATANAEMNLANSRDLFESYGELLFSTLMRSRVEHVELGKLTAPGSGITYGVVKPGGEGTVAFVRGGDLVDGTVRMDRLRTISQEFSRQYSRTLLRGGELLICLVGTPGECAIAPKELAGANIARQVGMIRLHEDLSAEYVRDYLLSIVGQKALGLKTGGSVQQVINLGDLKLIEIPLPDFRTQYEIVEKIRLMKMSVRHLERCYRIKLAELAALQQSLLERAFSGELAASETIAS